MKILFVSSGNSGGVSPIVKNQGNSLSSLGHEVHYFTIQGKGLFGYLKSTLRLRRYLNGKSFDVIHAHYSLSGFVVSLTGVKPIVSLMGSDVKAGKLLKPIIRLFVWLSWKKVIVKSLDMRISSGIGSCIIIPNGVDFERFKPLEKENALRVTDWNANKKHILFAANPERLEKNYKLALSAFKVMDEKEVELHVLKDIDNQLMPYFLNAADVVLLTSHWEGSPNVIKEAMACNVPIVATRVGDIEKVIGNTQGCFLCSFDYEDVSKKIRQALEFAHKTNGREQIQYLDSVIIAHQIERLYSECIAKSIG